MGTSSSGGTVPKCGKEKGIKSLHLLRQKNQQPRSHGRTSELKEEKSCRVKHRRVLPTTFSRKRKSLVSLESCPLKVMKKKNRWGRFHEEKKRKTKEMMPAENSTPKEEGKRKEIAVNIANGGVRG